MKISCKTQKYLAYVRVEVYCVKTQADHVKVKVYRLKTREFRAKDQ